MTETYTSGRWAVRTGEEDAFAEEWKAFVTWASGMPGSGTFRLVREVERPSEYVSLGAWENLEAQAAWREHPEFAERLGRVRSHCEEFQPATYELVTQVS